MNIEVNGKKIKTYKEQYWYGENFLENFLSLDSKKNLTILEIGSAEAGLLKYFSDKGHNCYGLEYSESRHKTALQLNSGSNIKLICADITIADSFNKDLHFNSFDIIIMRDVIEHIHDKQKALTNVFALLKDDGIFYISFPPKYSPYAGHQQNLPGIIGKLPYIHLLPGKFYNKFLKSLGLNEDSVASYTDVKKTRLSLSNFFKLIKTTGFKIERKEYYLIRPNFEIRYNMKRIRNRFSFSIFSEIFTLGSKFILTK